LYEICTAVDSCVCIIRVNEGAGKAEDTLLCMVNVDLVIGAPHGPSYIW